MRVIIVAYFKPALIPCEFPAQVTSDLIPTRKELTAFRDCFPLQVDSYLGNMEET